MLNVLTISEATTTQNVPHHNAGHRARVRIDDDFLTNTGFPVCAHAKHMTVASARAVLFALLCGRVAHAPRRCTRATIMWPHKYAFIHHAMTD